MLFVSSPNNSSGTSGVIHQSRYFNPAFCLQLKMREMPLDLKPARAICCFVSPGLAVTLRGIEHMIEGLSRCLQ